MSLGSPINQLPVPYMYNLGVSWGSNTTLSIGAGQCWDSTFTFPMTLPEAVTLDASVNGVNGLDTGSLAANTWYSVYLIGDETNLNPVGTLLAVTGDTPIMPNGSAISNGNTYSLLRQIGFARTDGSSHFYKFYMIANNENRNFYWQDAKQVLTDGAATTYTAIDISAGVPPIDKISAKFNVEYVPHAADNEAFVRIAGTAASNAITIAGPVTAKTSSFQFDELVILVSGVPKIEYKCAEATDLLELYVNSFAFQV